MPGPRPSGTLFDGDVGAVFDRRVAGGIVDDAVLGGIAFAVDESAPPLLAVRGRPGDPVGNAVRSGRLSVRAARCDVDSGLVELLRRPVPAQLGVSCWASITRMPLGPRR
ncbi:carbonic anhydrase [Kineococcus indalonis]|uniref:hypothetical protein n=1 Tax=Kineococcus indalonis TaxID=2696566 RepID=UPI001412BC4F|nr:hypothetical protein [Kineococcus indalonis]NAZ86353.1 hypothetical protein [Kineococcus indalonis]